MVIKSGHESFLSATFPPPLTSSVLLGTFASFCWSISGERKATMTTQPSLGELLLGIEGLALLRLAFTDAVSARRARLEDMRS
jgi:hypothetical protein